MYSTRRRVLLAGCVALVLAVAGCGDGGSRTVVSATFGQAGQGAQVISYDRGLAPDGARAKVVESVRESSTTVTLKVHGLVPNRAYGAHAHALPCGPTGDAAGPHFQHASDPVKPSVDPAYANPLNEIWLDFTTNAQGDAKVTSTVPWVYQNTRAFSVIIHAEPTQTGPGKAGTAGARVACLGLGS
ncbi:superoxide dismutase family protein [Pseudonocardia acaciae]|uniref:superoxide dismutase family protein n=1 Tax=Pseudonocardia acaciae TaxID=551276 RepID=UPI00048D2B18|nr:superoxide dismutase family protein [Pseudonocardia acaciae]